MKSNIFAGALALAAATLAVGPVVAAATPLPSYATAEETIKGTISSVDGKYKILVRDERGYIDDVSLRDGTVINPTGLTLTAGQTVTVLGHNAGSTFRATEIDTPYHRDYATEAGFGYAAPYAYPDYPYYGGGYGSGYGYPYYGGYPGYYGSIGFFFGGGYGNYGRGYYGHGYYGHGGYGYYGHGNYGHGGYGYYGHGARGSAGYGGAYGRGGLSSGRGFAAGGFRGGGGHAHR